LFKHPHPYPPYIPEHAKKLIVGTLLPPRFSKREFRPGDVDFNYGSRDGQLWTILGRLFETDFLFETTQRAVVQRQDFLKEQRIGISDMVSCAYREKMDASDIGIKAYELRNLITIIRQHPEINMLLFTGGNSKNGPEYFFRKHLKNHPEIRLKRIGQTSPRVHEFRLDDRRIRTVSLTAPSGAANRAVGSKPLYKKLRKENPDFSAIDYRVLEYRPFFMAK